MEHHLSLNSHCGEDKKVVLGEEFLHYRKKKCEFYVSLKLEIQEVGLNIMWYAHGSQLGPEEMKRNRYRSRGKCSEC